MEYLRQGIFTALIDIPPEKPKTLSELQEEIKAYKDFSLYESFTQIRKGYKVLILIKDSPPTIVEGVFMGIEGNFAVIVTGIFPFKEKILGSRLV